MLMLYRNEIGSGNVIVSELKMICQDFEGSRAVEGVTQKTKCVFLRNGELALTIHM